MAAFDLNGKRTTAVYIRARRNNRVVYYREQYNIVRYNVDTNPNALSYIEGIPQDGVGTQYSAQEMYDDVLICDAPPWPGCRIGQQPAH